jgi:hypothetical protein
MSILGRIYLRCVTLAAVIAAVGLLGCSGEPTEPSGSSGFISDSPGGNEGDDRADSGSSGVGGGGPVTPEDADRTITEADIIHVQDNRLYALSRYSGLSVIDVSVKDNLTLLGHYAASGIPFEIYVREGVAYTMFSSWGQDVYDESSDTYKWVQTSRIEALDVSNPSHIQQIGSFDLPGAISDSRMVGDVIYTVTFEDGYCYRCATTPNTTVTALSVKSPASIGIVDRLSYTDDDPNGYGWHRSVTVTQNRMYIAGIEWNGSSEGHSTIQVIDISDPAGHLVQGASVEAKGQIQSRWQMDEYNGVLRVISQPGVWWTDAVPAVQTFTVVSSQDLQPLGYAELSLPKPESLRAARFDGERAYAITAEQIDPLFTIDLSDPAHPKQAASLEIPGWIYYIEPRGDRLYTLGFDNTNPTGSLHVSLFNVADLKRPLLLERVAFGGEWSSVGEDQDRIHKAFKILDDLGLVLVPYSAWDWDTLDTCGSYKSGIQLIDFTADTLKLRGVAPSRGQARRAFVHDTRLFAVSDEEVRTFNIDDRDAPVRSGRLPLAINVSQTAVVGALVARLNADWWTSEPRLEVAPVSDPSRTLPLGGLDLAPLLDASPEGGCGWGMYGARLFAEGQYLYFVWPSGDGMKTRIAVIDLTDATAPKIAGQLTLDSSLFGYGYYGGAVASGDTVVQAGTTLVFRHILWNDFELPSPSNPLHAWLDVVDLSNPTSPALASKVPLRDGLGYTLLRVEGTTVMTSHWESVLDDSAKVKFYFDRVNVANPHDPTVFTPVNVPGSLVMFDGASRRILTVDYNRIAMAVASGQDCWSKYGYAYGVSFEPEDPKDYYGYGSGTCTITKRSFKLCDVQGSSASLIDVQPIEDGTHLSPMLVGDDRVFAVANNVLWYKDSDPSAPSYKLMVVGGMRDGLIHLAYTERKEAWTLSPVETAGQRLLLASWSPSSLWVLDATNLDNLTVEKRAELPSYAWDVTVSGNQALCSMGPYGLAVADISP